jgi:hypothetical protein
MWPKTEAKYSAVHNDDDDDDDEVGTMPMHGDHTSTGNDGSTTFVFNI